VSSDPSLNTPKVDRDSSLSASGGENDSYEKISDMDVSVSNSAFLRKRKSPKIRSRSSSRARNSMNRKTVFNENGVKVVVSVTKNMKDLEQTISDQTNEIENLKKKIDKLDFEIASKDTGYQNLARQFDGFEREKEELRTANSELRRDLEHKSEEEETLRGTILEQRKKIAELTNKHLQAQMDHENKEKDLSDKTCRLERDIDKVKSELHKANDNLHAVENMHKSGVGKLNTKIHQLKDQLEDKDLELEKLNQDCIREKNAHIATKSALNIRTEEFADLEGRLSDMDLNFSNLIKERDNQISKLKESNNKRAEALSALKNKCDLMQTTNEKLASSIYETHKKQQKSQDDLKSSKNTALKKVATMEMQLDVFKTNEEKYHSLIDGLKRKLKAKDEEMNQRRVYHDTEVARFKKSKERLTSTIKKLEEVGASHSESQSKLKSDKNRITKKYNLLVEQYRGMRTAFQKKDDAIQELEARIEELMASLVSEKEATSKAQKQASVYCKQASNLNTELASLRNKFKKMEDNRNADLIALRRRIEELQKELQSAVENRTKQSRQIKKLRVELQRRSARLVKYEGCVQNVVKATDEVSSYPPRSLHLNRRDMSVVVRRSRSGSVKSSILEEKAEGLLSAGPEESRPYLAL